MSGILDHTKTKLYDHTVTVQDVHSSLVMTKFFTGQPLVKSLGKHTVVEHVDASRANVNQKLNRWSGSRDNLF